MKIYYIIAVEPIIILYIFMTYLVNGGDDEDTGTCGGGCGCGYTA